MVPYSLQEVSNAQEIVRLLKQRRIMEL